MKVTIGEAGLKKTWQAEFPKTIKCRCSDPQGLRSSCGGEARIAFVVHEGIDEDDKNGAFLRVCSLHPNKGKGGFWLHDCCAVAVYFCQECLEPTALYNQR